MYVPFSVFCVLFVRKYVLFYSHRKSTQLQLYIISCAFVALRNATTSFVSLSVLPSVRPSARPPGRPHETDQKYVPSDSEGTYFRLNLTCVILTGRWRPTRRNPHCLLPGLGSNSLNYEDTPFCLPLQLSPECQSGTSVISAVRYASCSGK
jgi:hypothetical protein